MRTSLNPLMYKDWSWMKLFETPGTFSVTLSPGIYSVLMRGGGGAGGQSAPATTGGPGGLGGAGGTGKLVQKTINVWRNVVAEVYVGTGGLTKANGGNGGNGGSGGQNRDGGGGGGGGMPTYLKRYTGIVYSDGGGGGGGGGGTADTSGRYANAGCGGGGGGFYRIQSDGSVISVPGQVGSMGGGDDWGSGTAGVAGNTLDFSTVYSGQGGRGGDSDGAGGLGGAAAYGGGASGGGGGAGTGNHSSSRGGGGGGGAGGDDDAGGGQAGGGRTNYSAATDGSNYHTTPTPSTNYQGNTSNLGMGGATNENGYSGWLCIMRVGSVTITDWDLGSIAAYTTEIKDCGAITAAVTETSDMGNI